MKKATQELTKLDPRIIEFQDTIRARYATENATATKGQILFVGSSLMEIFPIEKMQAEGNLGLDKIIYNRGVRATTTADLLKHIDLLILNLAPSKIFINIGSNDVGFQVPTATFMINYSQILATIQAKLPNTEVYLMDYYPVNTAVDFGETKHEHSSLFKTRSNADMDAATVLVHGLAAKFGYHAINVNSGLTDADGNLKAELTFDGVHMLPTGYTVVLANLMEWLQ